VECAPSGVRVVCLHTTAIRETPLIDEVWEIQGKSHGISQDQFNEFMAGLTHRRRLTTLKELANAAVFVASDEGSGITGTIFNLTAGMVV
jgi:NAD(P)-dependent dehydrogenase (short-subunit alcohol dehydrogenase family)